MNQHPPAQTTTPNAPDALPVWDLSDLYASPQDPAIQRDLSRLETECCAFAQQFKNKLASLSAPELLTAVHMHERIDNTAGRIMSFAVLLYQQMTTDPIRVKFLSDMQDKITELVKPLVFFTLEINRIEADTLNAVLASDPALAHYKSAFDKMRTMLPYQLSDELEQFLHDQSVVGASAWVKLYDETLATLQFTINDTSVNLETALNALTHTNRSERAAAAHELARVFGANSRLFTRIWNTLIKEKDITDTWRKMPQPETARHLSNQVEPAVIDALHCAVTQSYPHLSHRYYRLKARLMGLERLQIWDRNAPLFQDDSVSAISWSEAKTIVHNAYREFSPTMAQLADPFLAEQGGWIDAAVKTGKSSGAFAHPTVTDVHPYILLNYQGKTRDVMTLAHELGHGVHQRLAAKQGEWLSATPLTLAETASIFGEMITFQSLLSRAEQSGNNTQYKFLLANKIEDMLNTVVRQIAFYDFERKMHRARKDGELTTEAINAMWLDVQRTSLGSAVELMSGYESFWVYIGHFIHAPFYVYAYAFGHGLVNALFALYQQGEIVDFETKYIDLLAAGGSRHYNDVLLPFGLDAANPDFWHKGLSVISSLIDDFERSIDKT